MFDEIDKAIENASRFQQEKEKRLQNIKNRISEEKTPDVRMELVDWLIGEYEAFNSDSSLYYINVNLKNPIVVSHPELQDALLIKKADVAAHAGLFGEAAEILNSINESGLDKKNLESYYSAYCDLYQYQIEYSDASEYTEPLVKLREIYIDSIGKIASPSSINYVVNRAASEARNGNFNNAELMLLEQLDNYQSGDRNYSILSSILADIYKQQGDRDNYTKYLGKSAISDLQGAVKENMAMRALATVCFEEGDLERAERYLRQSFADANFYAARMRNAQSSRMLPIIGEAYTSQQKKMTRSLRLLVIFLSIISLGFIGIAGYAIIQEKKVRKVNKKTSGMLAEVSALSKELSELNKELSLKNQELRSSDVLKEQYAGLFMEYCSMAISALQQYQQSLKVTAAQGSMLSLVKKIDSSLVENKTLAEFYSRFDEAILNIYPRFVEKFNALLKPEEIIELKPKEALNTELRVFALIRIGITDSEKIAKFLRCSITTVYTYRSKIKKRALNPDKFEDDLMQI